MKRGLALGCGGTLGAAWTVGVLAALEEGENWDPRGADAIIGTSAGAEYGAMFAAGVPVSDMVAAYFGSVEAPDWLSEHLAAAPNPLPPIPWPRLTAPGLALRRGLPRLTRTAGLMPTGRDSHDRMLNLGKRLAGSSGWVDHKAFFAVAADLKDGARVAFGAPGAPAIGLPEAIAASWAVPGCYPPVTAGGHRYVDGGAASTASVDLLLDQVPDLDEIIVIAPMSSSPVPKPNSLAMRIEGSVRRQMSAGLQRECALAESRGVKVRRFEIDAAALRVTGPNFNDARRRRRVFEHGLSHARGDACASSSPS